MRYHALCHRRLRQIPVARRARNAGASMWGVLKLNVRRRRKPIHARPRNFDTFIRVVDDLLYFRLLPRQLGVTQHAFCDRRNASRGADIGARMAIDATQAELDMRLMWKRDRLARGVRHDPKPQ